MPVRKTSGENGKNGLRVAGLILRRHPEREFHSYLPLLPYQPSDYQILLRTWPTPPFKGYLGTFSGPAISGHDPPATLVQESYNWTQRLAQQAKLRDAASGVTVRRTEFISVHGGGRSVDPISGHQMEMGITLCYVLPTTTSESSVVSRYPTSSDYPQFYDLSAVLQGMMSSGTLNVHPLTREMLSALDKWLRERHTLSGAINLLFSQSLESRLKMYVSNPLHAPPVVLDNGEEEGNRNKGIVDTPNVTFLAKKAWPISSSTPFQHPSEDSTLYETTAFSMERPSVTITALDQSPADMVVKNPLFSSGLKLSKVDVMVVNQHFGKGVPDYDSLRERQGVWAVHVEGDGMQDWVDLFPMHKCACEGDVEGVRRCVRIGVSPDERDSDSWAPLHYACWYGELEVVKALVEEASADLGVINNTDSTPLHLAAATGHSEVVAYLLRQPGIRLVQTAIDCEGKSPLAVCLECRQKEWSETRRLLQEAYKTAAVHHNLTCSPSLLSHPSPPHNLRETSLQPVLLQSDLKSLSECGSQASLTRRADPGKERERVVRRQRVDFVSGQHHLAHFSQGKDTPTTNVLKDIYNLIQLAPQYHNMLALWIQSDSLAIQLGDGDKPLSLMSTWPSLLTRHVAKTTVAEVPSLCVRRNVFISQAMERSISDPNILEILFFDARRHVLTGQYPCTEMDAIELGGIFMQVSYGDHTPMVHHSGFLQGRLEEVLPVAMVTSKRRVEFERRVLTQHSKISQDHSQTGDSQAHLHKMYLQKCWQWPFYGSAFFPGSLATKSCQLPKQVKLGRKSHVPVSVAVNTLGFHLISMETNSLVISLSYGAVKWDISINKHRLLLSNSDNSLHVEIHTKMVNSLVPGLSLFLQCLTFDLPTEKQAELLNSLVSRMTEQYLHSSHSNTSATPTPQTQHDA